MLCQLSYRSKKIGLTRNRTEDTRFKVWGAHRYTIRPQVGVGQIEARTQDLRLIRPML